MQGTSVKFLLCLGLVTVVLGLGLPGCSTMQNTPRPERNLTDRERAHQFLQELRRSFRREDSFDLVDLTSRNYGDGFHNRNDLRWALSDVFRQYSMIDLTIYGTRVLPSEETLSLDVNWNLRWICSRVGDGCPSKNTVVLRSGSTHFVLVRTNEGLKLQAQGNDRLLGSATPGRRIN